MVFRRNVHCDNPIRRFVSIQRLSHCNRHILRQSDRLLISVAMFTKQHRHSQPSTSSRSNHTIISHYRYWSINYSNHQPVSRYHTLRLPVVFGGWLSERKSDLWSDRIYTCYFTHLNDHIFLQSDGLFSGRTERLAMFPARSCHGQPCASGWSDYSL